MKKAKRQSVKKLLQQMSNRERRWLASDSAVAELRSLGSQIYADLPAETTVLLCPLTAGCISGIAFLPHQRNKKPLLALSSLCVSYSAYSIKTPSSGIRFISAFMMETIFEFV